VLAEQLVEGQQLGLGGLQQGCDLGCGRGQLVDHLDQPRAGLSEAGGLEDAADRRGDHGLLGLADMAEHVAQEEELAPERLSLGLADVDPQHLAAGGWW
jgi:hypothetical protein